VIDARHEIRGRSLEAELEDGSSELVRPRSQRRTRERTPLRAARVPFRTAENAR
jgi:hypothetical protein